MVRNRSLRHAVALATMVGGSAAVFGINVLMNEYTRPKKAEATEKVSEIDLVKRKKKPPQRSQQPRQVQRPSHDAPRRAPAPAIDSAISSVDIAMPGFDGSQLGAVSDAVLGVSEKNQIMDEGSVDTPPNPVERVAPEEYPRKARERGIEGFVTLNLLIDTSGTIERVKVLQAEPAGVFEEVALATIRRWRFKPAVYEAAPVRAWAKQTIRFELN